MSLYLHLMWSQPPDDFIDERLAIKAAFEESAFQLISEPEQHARGGFRVRLEGTADDWDEIAKLLEENNLLPVI